jgi:hypothetical protein
MPGNSAHRNRCAVFFSLSLEDAVAKKLVMPGLDPGIHAASIQQAEALVEWIAGSSPAMTETRDGQRLQSIDLPLRAVCGPIRARDNEGARHGIRGTEG